MARTPSNLIPMGTPMPPFSLPDAAGGLHDRDQCVGHAGTLVIFMCNHCPFVVHVADQLAAMAADYTPRGIGFVGINSNDIDVYPQDGPTYMVEFRDRHRLGFPYLLDATQAVARAFDATCTPDFFLYANEGNLIYHGQLDESRPDSGMQATGHDLRRAMNALLEEETISDVQVPSIGCNIKWKAAD